MALKVDIFNAYGEGIMIILGFLTAYLWIDREEYLMSLFFMFLFSLMLVLRTMVPDDKKEIKGGKHGKKK